MIFFQEFPLHILIALIIGSSKKMSHEIINPKTRMAFWETQASIQNDF